MNFSRIIAPFILIPLMLFSSIGFSIDVHFCKGEVKSVGLFNATPCKMEGSMNLGADVSNLPPCHQKKIKAEKENSEHKNGLNSAKCCHNKNVYFIANSDLEPLLIQNTNLLQVNAVIVFTTIRFNLLKPNLQLAFYRNYKPPLIDEDISILHQVFRI